MSFSSQLPSREFLWNVFQGVDRDRSGYISADELQSALSNGTWNPFNIQTVKLMIGMFDRQGRGTVSFEEFGNLWKYVVDWQNCFRGFDRDNSGSIDREEFSTAISAFGYRLGGHIIDLLVRKFDSQQRGAILFDDFIRCCVVLNKCVALRYGTEVKSVEDWLRTNEDIVGWKCAVLTSSELVVLFVLAEVMHNQAALPSEPLYDLPDVNDYIRIFWNNGCAKGFYTLKRKGTMIEATQESYSLNILDTSYVLPDFRRRGVGLSIFYDIIENFPREDIGVSKPISHSMAQVLSKFLHLEPAYKMKIWEVEGTGSNHGSKKLFFYCTYKQAMCTTVERTYRLPWKLDEKISKRS